MPATSPPIRAFQWDLARQVERLDWLLAQLPRYADWGYQELYLHLEDAVAYPSLPGVARRDAYSYRELARLAETAARVGIGVVPIVNLLGHTQYLIKVPALRDLNELRDEAGRPRPAGQICPSHPRTLEVAEKLLRDMRPFCTTGKVHVGLDESFHLGRHPLSRADVARRGLPAHFAGYVRQLHALNQSLGLRTGMWADMLYFLPEAIPLLPAGLIAYDWYYYPFRRHPRVEFFNFVARDLAAPLQRQGIAYWGCPMNGSFRHEPMPVFGDRLANALSWWQRCHAVGAEGFLMTSWEPSRLAQETTTLVDAAVASLWLEPSAPTPASLLAAGARRLWGGRPARARAIARSLLAGDAAAFTGYARWEINRAWNLASGYPRLTGYREELRRVTAVAQALRRAAAPAALNASLALRTYLAQRDVFVHQARAGILALRRAVARGRRLSGARIEALLAAGAALARQRRTAASAAARMWTLTRRPAADAPNRMILEQDRRQLRALLGWLRRVRREPARILGANPVCGRWQVFYDVWNFAPAVQQVTLQQWRHGAWVTLKACHTIEFAAAAAVRRSACIRRHSAPCAIPPGAADLRLRLVLRGTGAVKIGRLVLTSGSKAVRPAATRAGRWIRLGAPAPGRGLPALDRTWTLELPPLRIT
ncbi:MAG: family 20 glycosylhydrolase [Opitutaceae bacterium]|nr:family 20 glycosylhydrolase [Opitutaceae bacterium]